MTEQEWLQATDPQAVVEFLRSKRIASRKARLVAVALCRRIGALLPTEESRKAIEVVERYVEGEVKSGELVFAERATWNSAKDAWAFGRSAAGNLARAVAAAAAPDTEYDRSAGKAWDPLIIIIRSTSRAWLSIVGEPRAPWQAKLVRDVFGPFLFLSVIIDPAWLTWHDGLLVSMARQIYDSRDFRDMPVLADALEDAGCTDQDILNHCRQPGEHVRGCWVFDLLLGEE